MYLLIGFRPVWVENLTDPPDRSTESLIFLPRSLASWRSSTQGHVELLPQQKVVANLVHPRSPVARLLVDHNTGSGKTLCMIRVLDNFFFDARAKIVIFPKASSASKAIQSLLTSHEYELVLWAVFLAYIIPSP